MKYCNWLLVLKPFQRYGFHQLALNVVIFPKRVVKSEKMWKSKWNHQHPQVSTNELTYLQGKLSELLKTWRFSYVFMCLWVKKNGGSLKDPISKRKNVDPKILVPWGFHGFPMFPFWPMTSPSLLLASLFAVAWLGICLGLQTEGKHTLRQRIWGSTRNCRIIFTKRNNFCSGILVFSSIIIN